MHPEKYKSPFVIRDENNVPSFKVPFRAVYCTTFRGWLASLILCHVVYRLDPPYLPSIQS